MIKVSEFKDRREKLYRNLDDDSCLVLFSGISKLRSADEDYNFSVNTNFYYLTNIKQEGSVLLVTKTHGLIKEYLFIQPFDEIKEKWTGKRLTPIEAKTLSGINNILFNTTFEAELKMILEDRVHYADISKVYLDLDREQKIGEDAYVSNFHQGMSMNYSSITFEDVYEKIIRLRMVKSTAEIEEFKEAISKTNIGIQAILKNLRPGKYEYQLSSLFYYTVQDYDYSELSFPTIAAAGVNATCLHYPTPLSKCQDGDLILFDLGARNNFYCADISRTFPINGKFNPLQKTIYNIVLECNKLIVRSIRPGVTIAQLQEITVNFLAKECVKAKLIKEESEISNYYFHNISHHIGLDTHDPSIRSLPLVPGNVISDEPGLYFKELGIGVRIEDDILVTEDGSFNLSGIIIKEVEDIENAMAYCRD